jgi:hydrogenase nickel incorporation protein HypB
VVDGGAPELDVATANRERLRRAKVLGMNVIGGPGCGKTMLLDATMDLLRPQVRVGVIACDPATHHDADVIRRHADQVVQVDTGEDRPLSAALVHEALRRLDLDSLDVLFMENVGTLVGPVDADLGQDAVVLIFSVAQGQDQPDKHPHLVTTADAILLNQIDLLPSVPFDLEAFRASVRGINPGVPLFEVCALLGEKLEPWVQWLRARTFPHGHPANHTNGSHWFG